MASLSIKSVSKSFGATRVLREISLSIESGDLFFILGASGCGKSTLLRIIAGLESPDSGSVVLDGEDITSAPAHRRGIGMVFQQYALWPHMTVAQNVSFGLEVQGVPSKERDQRVREALELVRMSDLAARYPHEISGGQQQRVALARALAVRPRIILLDEPLSNLDARLRDEIRHELQELHRELNLTMVYVTHDQEDALTLATKIALLRSGSVEQVGPPRELYERPATSYVASFLGSANLLRCSVGSSSDSLHVSASLAASQGGVFLARRGAYTGEGPTSLCVRPEHIRVSAPSLSASTPSISAIVRHISYKGAHLDIECESASGERVLSRAAPSEVGPEIAAGASVALSWSPDAAVIVASPERS